MEKKDSVKMPAVLEDNLENVSKSIDYQLHNSDNFANLISEIIVENLIRKYKGKYSKVSFKDASEVPTRLNRDKDIKEQ